jgi:VCBS repeat-containing protein
VQIRVTVDTPASGYLLNQASISALEPDPDPNNNYAELSTPVNNAPVLDAIGAQSGNEQNLISFDANATDSDIPANGLTFSLDAGNAAGAAIDPISGLFAWTPSETQGPGVYPVTITVTDDGTPNLSDFEVVQITVNEVNVAPVAADDVYTTTVDTTLVIAPAGVLDNDSDADLPANTLSAVINTQPTVGNLTLAADGSFVYTPALNYNGTVTFTYFANDGALNSNLALVTITITPVNDDPVPNAGPDQSGNEGDEFQFHGSYDDPGLLKLQSTSITWDFGDGITTTGTLAPSHIFVEDGTYTVMLIVDDGDGGVASDSLVVTVENVAPILEPITNQSILVGEVLTLTSAYSDPGVLDTHEVTIDWGDGDTDSLDLEAGLAGFDYAHRFNTTGTYTVTVTIVDNDGESDKITFSVNVQKTEYFTYLPIIVKK